MLGIVGVNISTSKEVNPLQPVASLHCISLSFQKKEKVGGEKVPRWEKQPADPKYVILNETAGNISLVPRLFHSREERAWVQGYSNTTNNYRIPFANNNNNNNNNNNSITL